MDLLLDKLQNPETNDDDYGSYFLQPASSPYNIAEKVQQANIDLFSSTVAADKTSRVTFKDELTSYEPELFLTDDDVNSLESDPPEPDPAERSQILEYKSSSVINLNIFDISEEEEEIDEIVAEECGVQDGPPSDSDESHHDNPTARVSGEREPQSTPKKKKKVRKKSPMTTSDQVQCKNHCIERLDFDMSMSIKKLEIREKPLKCPLLKLQRRKCCDENRARNPPNLPCYNGLRSEYGLSSGELQKRQRRKEIIRLKEQKRQQLLDEYKNRRNQQNEEVFCQWLKDVARRKAQKQGIDAASKQCFSPNVISLPAKGCQADRPKTAEFVPRQSIKRARRPHTSACVFIEVPQRLLERGIQIGDLLVSNSSFAAKKMHIVAVSS